MHETHALHESGDLARRQDVHAVAVVLLQTARAADRQFRMDARRTFEEHQGLARDRSVLRHKRESDGTLRPERQDGAHAQERRQFSRTAARLAPEGTREIVLHLS